MGGGAPGGAAARKLSKITEPGILASDCQVPALSSNCIEPTGTQDVFHASLYLGVQPPGTPPPTSGAVSNETVPAAASCRILKNLKLVASYATTRSTDLAPRIFL